MKWKECSKYAVSILLLSAASSALPDSIKTIDGDSFSGRLLTFQDGICVFKSKYGSTLRIPKNDIAALSAESKNKITLISGEVLIGSLEMESEDTVVLVSPVLGRSPIQVTSIESIIREFSKPSESSESQSVEYGEEDKQAPPLEFLTGSTVLLDEGRHQLEFGIDYRQNRDSYPLPAVGNFENHSYTARMVRLDATLRSGWKNGIETFVAVPVTYTSIEQVSSNEYVRDTSETELGDIAFGIQYLLMGESSQRPAITLSIVATAPTGKKKYYDLNNDWKDPLNNSTGHWGIATGLSFVRTTDPAILFGGFNINYSLDEEIDGFDIEPGWGISSYWGVGFSLNDRLSLGSRLSHSYYSNFDVDGVEIEGSSSEAIDLSFSGSYRVSREMTVTPQVTFGLNDDAGAPILSMRFNRSI